MFPLFAARFFNADEEVVLSRKGAQQRQPVASAASPPQIKQPGPVGKPSSLRVLDLQTLPRDDGPPTELRAKKEKLAHYETQCSHVGGHLYVGGELVARSVDILKNNSITHVVNCVGFLYPPYFESDFAYQTLYLQDSPSEDIISVMYDVFDFIEAAPAPDHRVFIHCSQGVSRSTTLAIAYRMWKESRPYDDVFEEVKQMRGVANPNIGFICQLLQWQRRRIDEAHKPRIYRLAPQSASAPQYLVPKKAQAGLDARGAFVVYSGGSQGRTFVWRGAACSDDFEAAAQRFAGQLHRYENASADITRVCQGQEPEELWAAVESAMASEARCGTPPPSPLTPSSFVNIRDVGQHTSYDNDYGLYAKSLLPCSNGADSPLGSARSGRKTPRVHEPHAASPNDRLRKQARSEAVERERMIESARTSSGTGSTGASSYGPGSESARTRALDFQDLGARRHMTMPSPRGAGPALASVGRPGFALGRPPMTPRTGGSFDGGPSPSTGGRPASRLGIPRLALGGLNQEQSSGGDAAPARASIQEESAGVAELLSSYDESDDDDVDNTTTASDDINEDGDDETQRERPKEAGPAPRPPAVPKLNLGAK